MRKLIFAALLMLAAAPAWTTTATEAGMAPAVDWGDLTSEQIERGEKAYMGLAYACPGLELFASDIESVTAELMPLSEGNYWREENGWTQALEFQVRIREDVARIPTAWRANGHVLHFMTGGGTYPGLGAYKPQSYLVCDPDEARRNAHRLDGNWFKDVAKMRVVDDL